MQVLCLPLNLYFPHFRHPLLVTILLIQRCWFQVIFFTQKSIVCPVHQYLTVSTAAKLEWGNITSEKILHLLILDSVVNMVITIDLMEYRLHSLKLWSGKNPTPQVLHLAQKGHQFWNYVRYLYLHTLSYEDIYRCWKSPDQTSWGDRGDQNKDLLSRNYIWDASVQRYGLSNWVWLRLEIKQNHRSILKKKLYFIPT
jgi:hypothetical protein